MINTDSDRTVGASSRMTRPLGAPTKLRLTSPPEWLVGLLFLLPALIIYLVFVIYPIIQSVSYSVYDWSGPGREATWVGAQNYLELLSDQVFFRSLANTVVVLVVSLALQLPLALGLAMIITGRIRGRRIWRAVYFLPTLMSTVAIGILWGYIYNPTYGAINVVLRAIGLDSLTQGWLGQSSTALGAVLLTTIWQWAPFYMIIYSAAIVALPQDIYEAARMDGATNTQQFWRITLPLLRPVILTTAILSLIGSIKYFDLIYVMTNGGPNNATELMATYMFEQGFTNLRFGYASTISVAMLVLTLAITGLVLIRTWLPEVRSSRKVAS